MMTELTTTRVAGTPIAGTGPEYVPGYAWAVVVVAGPVGMPRVWAGRSLREARDYCEHGRLSGKAREGYTIEAVFSDGTSRTIALLRGYEGDWTAEDATLEAMGLRAMIGYMA